jgi:Rrf2 family transcriptional regulator, nitric oxide-sensitive transcriptional repressor
LPGLLQAVFQTNQEAQRLFAPWLQIMEMQINRALDRKGYLETVRGRGGGIRLRRPPRDINIGHVVRETESKLDVIGCLGRRDYCPIERVCVLRGVMHDAIQAFLAVLDGHTLADLIKPQRALSSLLL